MSREPGMGTPSEPRADPAGVLGEASRRIDEQLPYVSTARADGVVWIDLAAEHRRLRMMEELFNVGIGREPGSTRSLIDQTTATPKVTKARDAAHRMAERLAARGFELVRRV